MCILTESISDFRCNWIATEKKYITNGISAQSFDRIGPRNIYYFKLHSPNRPVKSCVTIYIRGISSKYHCKSRLCAHFNISGWVARFCLFTCGAPPLLSAGNNLSCCRNAGLNFRFFATSQIIVYKLLFFLLEKLRLHMIIIKSNLSHEMLLLLISDFIHHKLENWVSWRVMWPIRGFDIQVAHNLHSFDESSEWIRPLSLALRCGYRHEYLGCQRT